MIVCFVMTIVVSEVVDFGTKRQSLIVLILYIVLATVGGAIYLQVKIIPKRKNFEAQKQKKVSLKNVNENLPPLEENIQEKA